MIILQVPETQEPTISFFDEENNANNIVKSFGFKMHRKISNTKKNRRKALTSSLKKINKEFYLFENFKEVEKFRDSIKENKNIHRYDEVFKLVNDFSNMSLFEKVDTITKFTDSMKHDKNHSKNEKGDMNSYSDEVCFREFKKNKMLISGVLIGGLMGGVELAKSPFNLYKKMKNKTEEKCEIENEFDKAINSNEKPVFNIKIEKSVAKNINDLKCSYEEKLNNAPKKTFYKKNFGTSMKKDSQRPKLKI